MLSLGIYFVITGAGVALAARWSSRHRNLFETLGGGLFLVGLGFAGANFALVS